MGYTLRAPRPAALLPLLVVPVGIAFGLSPVVIAVIAALTLFAAWQRSLVLKVDDDGVQLGRGVRYEYGTRQAMITRVPWSAIRDVVVIGDREVGVRLKPGAPLSQGARATVSDPADPEAVQPDMRTRVPGRFDRQRLAAAVAAHGAHVVEINPG